MHLVLVWDWKTKRQGDAPRPRTAAGPRGYRTSPRQYVTNTLKKRMQWWQDAKKSALFYHVGHGKGDGYACSSWEAQIARKWEESQGVGESSEFIQE